MEYATMATADGTPIVRTAALRSFEKFKDALAKVGGRPPIAADGLPMVWNELRGWHPRTIGGSWSELGGRHHPMSERRPRLKQAESEIPAPEPANAYPFPVLTALITPADIRRQRLRQVLLDVESDRLRSSVDRARRLRKAEDVVYADVVGRFGGSILRPRR